MNILFGVDKCPKSGNWKLTVDVLDCNSNDLPLFNIIVNGKAWEYRIPVFNNNNSIEDEIADASEHLIEIPLPDGLITEGGTKLI